MAELGARGSALWALLTSRLDTSGPSGSLALEACRCADRLDGLNAVIVEAGVDALPALSEARQQQMALRSMLSTLGVAALESKSSGGSTLDDLAARRSARGAVSSDRKRAAKSD